MTETGDRHEANAKHFQSLIKNLILNNGIEFTKNSSYGQSVIWASERIAELEAEFSVPEQSGDEIRDMFFRLGYGCELTATTYCEAVLWGQIRIRHLERDLRDEQELLNQNSELRRENERLELENENLSKTILTISKSPQLASPETDEEIYERRRERLLDEITLICVRDRIGQLIDAGTEHSEADATTEIRWGRNSRDTADQICRGINEYDAKH